MKDILWQATPAEWARHAGQIEIEKYLREQTRQRETGQRSIDPQESQ
jgi:hypothetical protein